MSFDTFNGTLVTNTFEWKVLYNYHSSCRRSSIVTTCQHWASTLTKLTYFMLGSIQLDFTFYGTIAYICLLVKQLLLKYRAIKTNKKLVNFLSNNKLEWQFCFVPIPILGQLLTFYFLITRSNGCFHLNKQDWLKPVSGLLIGSCVATN